MLFGFTALLYVNGQLESCLSLRSCNITRTANSCTNTVRWTRCDGTLGYRASQCTNSGCIAGCECTCDTNGYGQSWENTCTGIVHSTAYECSGCSPTPTPTPNRCQFGERRDCFNCEDELDNDGDFDVDYDDVGCLTSPIVVDVNGNGFNLTDAQSGVLFDLDANSSPEQIAWTSANSDDAFLALDRSGNGLIDNGKELFGDVTLQPNSDEPNGFLALAEFDKPERGGNLDNQIDASDSVFAQLKLWQDRNHNGISESNELQNLSQSDIRVIELRYRESRRTDEHGNRFRYRAKVRDARGAQVGRWAWDVFLTTTH